MKMRKRICEQHLILKGLICLGVLGILIFWIYFENKESLQSKDPQLFVQAGEETISLFKKDDIYYLFLPGFVRNTGAFLADYSEEIILHSEDGDETRIKKKDSVLKLPLDTPIACIRPKNKEPYTLWIMVSDTLPTLFIDTASGSLDVLREDKEYAEKGNLRVVDSKGEVLRDKAIRKIHGRGNTSFNSYQKKPWNLELEKETELFDLGKGKKYVLISNGSDPTLVRNDLMRHLERALSIDYVKLGVFVDVYMNGEYQGNYYLCTPFFVGKDSIDITDLEKKTKKLYEKMDDSSAKLYEQDGRKGVHLPQVDALSTLDKTGGYLMERDYAERYRLEYDDTPSSFVTGMGEYFVVKSPKYCSEDEINYIASFMEEVESAIASKQGVCDKTDKDYKEYIDLTSFSKRYLAEEISKNYDAGVSSMFFYKDADAVDTRLFMAPGWDYDMCLGNGKEWMKEVSADPEGITKMSANEDATNWFALLYDKEDFYESAIQYYRQYAEPYLREEVPGLLTQYQETMGASILMNHCRWECDIATYSDYSGVSDAFAKLGLFVEQRRQFLNSEWFK